MVMKNLMNKPAVLLAAALLVTSTGIATARTQHRVTYGTGQTGELSSTNVRGAAGLAGYAAPHEVPENGGAATQVQPGFFPN
jgi:uncharacterized membrane protein YecN with MAPEG domain